MSKTAKPKLNVRLLRKIQRHITEEPRRFFMAGLVDTGKPGEEFECREWDQSETVPPCGTAACIAGWTAILSGKTVKQAGNLSLDWSARKLGLDPKKFGHSALYNSPLFFDWKWPEPFRSQYNAAKTLTLRAKIACARIDHLIATKGAE